MGGPWATGLALRLRRELAAANEQLRVEQEEKTRRAIAEERSTIARELHDVVAHAISVTVLQSRGARRLLGRDEDQVRRALDAIEHTNTQALGDMRRLLAILRDTEGDAATAPQPSLSRLDDLLDDVRGSGLPVEVSTAGDNLDVPPGVDLSAYRIIQEALTDVFEHAGPATARVELTYGEDDLTLRVTDDGRVASAPNGSRGHGLLGIRERLPSSAARWKPAPARRRLRGPREAPVLGRRMNGIRVVLADDQPLVRAGLRMILETESDIEIVGEASTGAEVVDICEQQRPDVVLMDVRMPAMDGIAATRLVTAAADPPRVLVLTHFRPRRDRLRRPPRRCERLPAQGRP